jgi:hypothetical protein
MLALPLVLLVPLVFGAAADSNCRALPKDPEWPSTSTWKAALEGVEERGMQMPNATSPDYAYPAKTVEQVQKAVKFAADNNVRLTILNSGHDFIGRYVVMYWRRKVTKLTGLGITRLAACLFRLWE